MRTDPKTINSGSKLPGARPRRLTSCLKSIMKTSTDAIAICDQNGGVAFSNASFKRMFGYSAQDTAGLSISDCIPCWPCGLRGSVEGRGFAETNGRTNAGEEFPIELSLADWREGAATFYCCVIRDLSKQRETERHLRDQLMYDMLTGLPNRKWFMETLQTTIDRHQRQPGSEFAVLFIDVDGFRVINDGLGTAAGDTLLGEVAERLASCLRSGDTVGRLSGDQFAILLDEVRSVNDALRVADRICEHASESFVIDGEAISVTVSVGITVGSIGYDQAERMLHDSHTAMHRAKSAGRGRVQIFDAQMHTKAAARLRIENDLRTAVAENQLRLHYQPIIDLRSSRIAGFEALVRWNHPTKGLIPPMAFIPIAEESGLIVSLGIWTLRESCRQAREWRERFPQEPPLYISVNLSPKQLGHRSLLDDVASALALADSVPGLIKLEITEGAILDNSNEILATLLQLKHMGAELFMDDFGTGYSSLSYLHRFPFDAIKIDRSFVSKLGANPRDLTIVRTIVELAHGLDLKVVAEGVETPEQADHLERLRCEYAQGYLYSKPVEVDAATSLLTKQAERHHHRAVTGQPMLVAAEAAL